MNHDSSFPKEVSEVVVHFDCYKGTIKSHQRLYLQGSIHTPNSESRLHAHLSSWIGLYWYTFFKCFIQAESYFKIGWLMYSTQYLNDCLALALGSEWRF